MNRGVKIKRHKDEKCKLTNAQECRLDTCILLLYTKYYLYTCKMLFKTPNSVELQRKIEWQWKIENCSSVHDHASCICSMLYCY